MPLLFAQEPKRWDPAVAHPEDEWAVLCPCIWTANSTRANDERRIGTPVAFFDLSERVVYALGLLMGARLRRSDEIEGFEWGEGWADVEAEMKREMKRAISWIEVLQVSVPHTELPSKAAEERLDKAQYRRTPQYISEEAYRSIQRGVQIALNQEEDRKRREREREGKFADLPPDILKRMRELGIGVQ